MEDAIYDSHSRSKDKIVKVGIGNLRGSDSGRPYGVRWTSG